MYTEALSNGEVYGGQRTIAKAGGRKRPRGISVLAVINMIGAGLGFLAAFGAGAEAIDPAVAGAAGALLAGMAAFSLVVAIGLWRLRNWARILAIILYSLSAVLGLISLAQGVGQGFFQLLIAGSLVAYLCRAPIREAFSPAAEPLSSCEKRETPPSRLLTGAAIARVEGPPQGEEIPQVQGSKGEESC